MASKKNGGPAPVMGHESLVDNFRTKAVYAKQLDGEVKEFKKQFRTIAAGLEGGRSFAFFGTNGAGAVTVSIPDPERESSRVSLTDKALAQLSAAGVDLTEAVEESVTYKLTGSWVEWLEKFLAGMRANGQDIPDGIEQNRTVRLKAGALGSVPTELRDVCLKDATVGVK